MEKEGEEGGPDEEGQANLAQIVADQQAEEDKERHFQHHLSQSVEEEEKLRAAEVFFGEDARRGDEH